MTDEEIETTLYLPTEEDKEKAKIACTNFIESIEDEPMEFQAFCLKMLTDSFADVYDIINITSPSDEE